MSDIAKILDYLKVKGYKSSSIRAEILSLLLESRSQLSTVEIINNLSAKSLKPNKTTVYRELDMLVQESVIGQINAGEKKLYELKPDLGHHHHLICTSCQIVDCVKIPENFHQMEDDMSQKLGFKIKNHIMEFFGECGKCQQVLNH
jgi:Fe2+ or Zn2+ uptake regulation protein